MMRCQTQGMCAPHGGCSAGVLNETSALDVACSNMPPMADLGEFVDYVWNLKQERDQLRDEVEAGKQWRTLALQFDRHRMSALAHLKAVVSSPSAANIQACQAFLDAAPVSGQVVEQLIGADAIESIVHYVVSKGDQDVLRRIVLEKRREAALTT